MPSNFVLLASQCVTTEIQENENKQNFAHVSQALKKKKKEKRRSKFSRKLAKNSFEQKLFRCW